MAMFDRSRIREGMTVFTRDGERLGRVFAVGRDEIQVEKGLFFPRDYRVPYDAIADIHGKDIILGLGKEVLQGARAEPHEEGPGARGDLGRERPTAREGGEVHGAVAAEEPGTRERPREAGGMRVPKEAEAKEKEVEEPVREAEVEVRETEVTVREEKVEVLERPGGRASRTPDERERRVAAYVREERAEVRTEGGVEGEEGARRDIEHPEEERRAGIRSPDEEKGKTRF